MELRFIIKTTQLKSFIHLILTFHSLFGHLLVWLQAIVFAFAGQPAMAKQCRSSNQPTNWQQTIEWRFTLIFTYYSANCAFCWPMFAWPQKCQLNCKISLDNNCIKPLPQKQQQIAEFACLLCWQMAEFIRLNLKPTPAIPPLFCF